MPRLERRVEMLELRPQPQMSHGMTQEALAERISGMSDRERLAFIKTITDNDLNEAIDYLKTNLEQQHVNT